MDGAQSLRQACLMQQHCQERSHPAAQAVPSDEHWPVRAACRCLLQRMMRATVHIGRRSQHSCMHVAMHAVKLIFKR